ncbi:MAG: sodium:proton antiporter NhaD [Bacteroidota bacterium]|nr:sodium:proton antiporter NhaD [Bacteroidota bacterium]
MEILLIIIFVLGYLAIAFEHPLHINKTAPALIIAALMWGIWAVVDHHDISQINLELSHELSASAQILFFLLGAMTIVELIDAHQGFKIITNRIKTKDSRKLLWIIALLTFFLSALLDNLTTAIVMVSLLRKLVHDKEQRLFFAGIVIIAANAGGAWSPIGDVTTTMLWIGGQISSANIIKTLLIPSLICMIVPLLIISVKMKGDVKRDAYDYDKAEKEEKVKGSLLMLCLGVGGLLFVPAFKTITHLPPYLGMLFSLAIVWIASELLHIDKEEEERKQYSAIHALSKIDTSSVLFFLGILLAIGVLQGIGTLGNLASWMDSTIGNKDVIALAIGLLSAVVDNVPIVAATMKMYSIETFPMDSKLWEFIAYSAGTGGSCLIIGSAAGVAVMGMEKIDFIWYLKKISWLALIGYLAGALAYIAIYPFFAVH